MKKILLPFIILLTSCTAPGIVIKDRPVDVHIPVAVGCVTSHPSKSETLKNEFTDVEWAAMDVKQRAAAVGKKGLEYQEYSQLLEAATAGCPDVKN